MTTASDIITGALRFINVYSPGESLSSSDSDDALATLNELLDSWSTDQASVYASDEDVFTFVPAQYRYTIGNYAAGTFAGTVTSGSAVITAATVPTNMVVGGDLTGTGIATGATIVSFNSGAGTVTMSAVGTSNPGSQQIAYTIPGDFKTTRPLRITNAFTRITTQGSGLDYPIEIIDQSRYVDIGYKAIQAPWPVAVWYNPTMPLGTLYFYQAPSSAGSLYLYGDFILSTFSSLTADINLPQGYVRALKRALARELAPEYGSLWTPQQERLYKEAYDMIKSLNAVPTPVANYDAALMIQPNFTDASWYLTGGFR